MRISQLSLRLLTGSILSAGLTLTVACGEEDPFQDLRDTSSDEDSEGEDSEGKDSEGKDSDSGDSDSGDSDGKDSRGDSDSDGQDSSTDDKKDTTGASDDSEGTDGSTTGGGDDTDSGNGNTDETTEPKENPICKLIPRRMVVLGDGTPAGAGVGGADNGDNGVKIFHQRLKNQEGLERITYENKSENNSLFVDAEEKQMPEVETGVDVPVLVVLHAGSSDLKKYILKSDADAENDFPSEWEKAKNALDGISAHFQDKSKFPKGAVFILNTIYNPFDDCETSVPPISAKKIELMGRFNQNVRDYAKGKFNFLVSDNHPALLGHGYNRNENSCPHYKANAEPYVKENLFKTGTDLNVAGQKAYSEVLMATYTKAFEGCKGQ